MTRHRQRILSIAVSLVAFSTLPAETTAPAVYAPGGMAAPYGALSPELAREVASIRGNPSSVYGKLMSRQWAYGAQWQRESLRPVENPNPNPEPQPKRDHPFDVALNGEGTKVYVTLLGSEMRPGSEVAVFDVVDGTLIRRIALRSEGEAGPAGSAPLRLALHPAGRYVFVTNRFSNFLSIIDTRSDKVVREVPVDFYCQGITFAPDGRTAWVANRYLDQVLVLEIEGGVDGIEARMRRLGGISEEGFFAKGGAGEILQGTCGTLGCHDQARGGLLAGADLRANFLTTLDHVLPGRASESRLLRSVTRVKDGGYADVMPYFSSHAGKTIVFNDPKNDPRYQRLAAWINERPDGPGIAVGNPRSKPRVLALSSDGRHLFVGNAGTQDISIVDTRLGREVGGIYLQNVCNDIKVYRSPKTGHDWLLITTKGVGFGTAKERDPWGGETWDRNNPASQYTVWRDPETAAVFPKERQEVLGPFEAIDGTANFKFRDIQNDLVVIDVSTLQIPEAVPAGGLDYLLRANRYEAHRSWVRYTSDTAEAMFGDTKGDIPPELMRVVGAMPEKMAVVGDRLFVSMQGTPEVQELRINTEAEDPADILIPVRTYKAGHQSFGIVAGQAGTPAADRLFVANFFANTLSVVDLGSGRTTDLVVDPSIRRLPVPATNAERGEFLVHTATFTTDRDQTCVSCHHDELSDGRSWGVSQVMGQEYLKGQDKVGMLVEGTTMLPPQQKSLWGIQPFFLEGSLSIYDPRSMLMEHCPADDFKDLIDGDDFRSVEAHAPVVAVADVQSRTTSSADNDSSLEERRAEFFRRKSLAAFGKAFVLRDYQRFVGEWQAHEPRLMPNPFDQKSASVLRGKALFEHPQLGCSSCHPAPHFAMKGLANNPRQVLPPQVPLSVRDTGFTLISMHRLDYLAGIKRDLEPWDVGRVEQPNQNQHITALQLRGAWDRPPLFLHNGMARTLREVVSPPMNVALGWFKYNPLFGGCTERPGRREVGFNETFMIFKETPAAKVHLATGGRIASDAHGGTSQLTPQQIDDLVNYLESIE